MIVETVSKRPTGADAWGPTDSGPSLRSGNRRRDYHPTPMTCFLETERSGLRRDEARECAHLETGWPEPDERALKFAVLRGAER